MLATAACSRQGQRRSLICVLEWPHISNLAVPNTSALLCITSASGQQNKKQAASSQSSLFATEVLNDNCHACPAETGSHTQRLLMLYKRCKAARETEATPRKSPRGSRLLLVQVPHRSRKQAGGQHGSLPPIKDGSQPGPEHNGNCSVGEKNGSSINRFKVRVLRKAKKPMLPDRRHRVDLSLFPLKPLFDNRNNE